MERGPLTIALAAGLCSAVTIVGYLLLGVIPALLFAIGYWGGFIAWLLVRSAPPFTALRWPFLATLALFIIHKWEEREFGFFPALADLTGVPMPEEGSPLAIALYALAGAWLLIPWLVGARQPFGYFLIWTFFISMGVTELAHFAFPLFQAGGYGYFPGMGSVIVLAPVAWLGIRSLSAK